jgi:perosamine synthetase
VYWIPVPLHPLYRKYKTKVPVTLKKWKELVTLPLFSDIKLKEINFIIRSLKEFDNKY